MEMDKRALVSEELLKMLAEGKVRYVEGARLKFGRWVLGRKLGEFIGCKAEEAR
jgi:hypothetical protein